MDPPAAPASAKKSPATIDYADPAVVAAEPRNMLMLALYQISLRIGWIFKTETVIVPAFLDLVGGKAWMRGCLPLLNRLGQSIWPVVCARRLTNAPRKKWWLFRTTFSMAAIFGLLAILSQSGQLGGWMPAIFLLAYAVFFSSMGLNQIALGTLQGKLIRPARRGRLLMTSTLFGGAVAISLTWLLLQGWLDLGSEGYMYIFGFTAVSFGVACVIAAMIAEPADGHDQPPLPISGYFAATGRLFVRDVHFRRLAVVASIYAFAAALYPHYQAMAKEQFGAGASDMVTWVIVQNLGTSLIGIFAGPLADRRGNRIVMFGLFVLASATPLVAVVLGRADASLGQKLYPLVYLLLGFAPVTIRTISNYTLEIAPAAEHPLYLSAQGLCLAVPLLFSPLFGLLIDLVGFEPVLWYGVAMSLVGAAMTLRLVEPRHAKTAPRDNLGHLPEQ